MSSTLRTSVRVAWRSAVALAVAAGAATGLAAVPAFGSSVTSAGFTGGSGTVSVGGVLYAKAGGALTLTVKTSADTKCVDVAGAFSGHQESGTAKSTWTFSFTASTGDGVQSVTATASPSFNTNDKCTGSSGGASASFVLDNTGPLVTGTTSPLPNAAGWNNSNVSIAWSATDVGSGVGSGPTPSTDSVTANTAGTAKTSTADDRLGNTGVGSVTVKLDKVAPTITGTRSPAANSNGWNNTDVTVSFTCSDALSGIKACSGATTLSSSAASQSATGTATDNADNTASATVSDINIDKVKPVLSGAPTTSPNSAGWYNSDVTVTWVCSDALSGIAGGCPPDSTISSEGVGLTASASVSDNAGNPATATSNPAVQIDKTAPNTTATAPTNWNNTNVTVSLNASDALSGVATTYYLLDGGAQQSGTSITIASEGIHTLAFWSVDNAGNVEAAKTVQVKIDETPPTISHTQAPAANGNGWNNSDVTVHFVCDDALSGIATCTPDEVISAEGANQIVTGTATDNAGNTANDPAAVRIDKTPPTIAATLDRAPNETGWYNASVTVTYACGDSLSGIDSCSAPQTLGEGANQSASGTAIDAAGNTASATVADVSVDETPPVLTGTPTSAPNANGYYTSDVTIHWACTDALSGVANAPSDDTITGEGNDLSASATCTDLAGNVATATVDGIKIDRTPPSTSAAMPDPLPSGWYAGAVSVTLNAVDSLSGVALTEYAVDGGTPQTYNGPFSFDAKGIHTVTFWSVDNAGNVEDSTAPGHSITLMIDGIPPTISAAALPAPNAFGWNNNPVTVSFSCSDFESGIAACSDPVTLSNEGAGQSATGLAQDNAGNTANTTVTGINIDMTPPTVTGAATTAPNAYGWYNGDVTIHWSGADGLSGIDPATQPADTVITGEGSNLGAGPESISDEAGNAGSGSVSGVRIDRTPPTISGATVNDDGTPRNANAAGWFNSAVRVRFACNDVLSGVQECGNDVVLSQDGANQSATGTTADKADNHSSATLSGINIDSQPPTSDASIVCTGKNGWCKGSTATVSLTATDQPGLSGVEEIHYSVDGGPWQVKAGASQSVSVPLAAKSGLATVSFYAVDNAGNAEAQNGVSLKYDNIAPTVTHTLTPPANAAGWNNSDVTVHFDATDDSDGSGVDQSSVTPDQTVATETTGTVVTGSAADLAGNVGTDSVTVKLDKTAPAISGAPTTSPNSSGWYTGPVTVHFTCADQGVVQSGIATCPADIVLSTDGADQSVTAAAVDRAGNSASTTIGGISIDATRPTIVSTTVADGAIYTLGDPAIPTGAQSCTASDTGSGVASCVVTVSGGLPNGVGTFAFTAAATDNAGNVTTQTGSYRVIYRWDGFLQPINDTAHQIGESVSIFKASSTVPAKFQLKRLDGSVVQANSLPQWLTPAKGGAITATIDETAYTDTPNSGTSYRYDSTSQQYIYNWGTAKNQAGYYWRIGVTLDDGQTYYVSVGLR